MNIQTFEDLLISARQQADAQRLLFVFAGSELPEDCTDEQRARFENGMGGAVVPLMMVDKTPEEISEFSQLIEESTEFAQDHKARDWALVFVAALVGNGKIAPTSEDADMPLRSMVQAIKAGSVNSFLIFDRQGQMVQLM